MLERTCLIAGAGLVLLAALMTADGWLGSRQALAAFEAGAVAGDAPLARLTIDRLGVDVPVLSGTDARTLRRGAGWVPGTASPGTEGNVVVSAHRDSYFRPLEHIRIGDRIVLEAGDGEPRSYLVEQTFVTDALDVSVLDPTDTAVLTLITCHPFRYVGFAPDRFIVRAAPENAVAVADAEHPSPSTIARSEDR